jgi:glycosyltransferase involved in cell wall biosynthesis
LNDLISVIIPTYKRPFTMLKRAIDSVINQSYSNLEIIIVDDSPNCDINRKEVESKINMIHDNRVKYIQHDYNKGACEARNTGIRNAKGEYLAFLDDDDEWLPNKLELQIMKFTDQQVGLVYCDSYSIFIKDSDNQSKYIRANRVNGWVYEKLIFENFIGSTSFVLIRSKVFDTCGLFNANMKSAQDYEMWLRISKKYKVDYVDIPLVNYYIHEGERITTNIDYKIAGLESLNEINMDYLSRHPKALSIRRLKIVPYYNIKFGHKKALLKWFEAIRTYPFQIIAIKYLIRIFIRKNK